MSSLRTSCFPHEAEVEKSDHVPQELIDEIKAKAIAAGIYAPNMPEPNTAEEASTHSPWPWSNASSGRLATP